MWSSEFFSLSRPRPDRIGRRNDPQTARCVGLTRSSRFVLSEKARTPESATHYRADPADLRRLCEINRFDGEITHEIGVFGAAFGLSALPAIHQERVLTRNSPSSPVNERHLGKPPAQRLRPRRNRLRGVSGRQSLPNQAAHPAAIGKASPPRAQLCACHAQAFAASVGNQFALAKEPCLAQVLGHAS